ncbi:hypothetical protein K501DRAFT_257674 [Backusella circina FSU 941]|nr:hypothetical protein K501DRAFT_257674 [Backusella circina FSU 941]
MSDSSLSIKDASGRHFSLLNDVAPSKQDQKPVLKSTATTTTTTTTTKRKYHCIAPGCNKSFTTSGHLARHNRIHTGEKNFHCLHPGCPSRFSRQDNMMQHYRTHLSQKARRQQQQLGGNNRQKNLQHQHHQYQPYPKRTHDHMFECRTENISGYAGTTKPYPLEPTKFATAGRSRRTLSVSSSSGSSTTSSFFNSPPPTFHSSPPPMINYYHEPVTLPSLKFHQEKTQFEPTTSQKSLSNLLHLANIVSTFG